MGLIKEPKDVNFSVQSNPWTEEELQDFRKLMKELKAKNDKRKLRIPIISMRKLLYFMTLLLMLESCCTNRNSQVEKISDNDKKWFPYKSMNSFIYNSPSGLNLDTLSIDRLDTSNKDQGEVCHAYFEDRICNMSSKRYKSLKFTINLSAPTIFSLSILYESSFTDYQCSLNSVQDINNSKITFIDSIQFNLTKYYKVLNYTDSLKNIKVYYNYDGIIRYIIKSDTMTLNK